jgi:nucleoside-diphosphate-sugar epimerase
VYGDHHQKFSESDHCRPISNYGYSKLKIEQVYLDIFKCNVSILRLGNVLGLDTVAKTFSEKHERDRYLDCRSDYSTPMRTYVDSRILSDIVFHYVNNFGDLPKILNVGRSRPQEMQAAVFELGMKFNLRITDRVLKDLTLDTSKLYQILNITEVLD